MCHETKPLSEYTTLLRTDRPSRKPRPYSYCKPCNALRVRQHLSGSPEAKERANARSTKWREDNSAHVADFMRRYYKSKLAPLHQRLRQEMLSAYGRACSCCGETTEQFLTLEHTRMDGKAHRKLVGGNTYADLKRRGWPKDGYTVFCMNCNWGSRKDGICPHAVARLLEEVAS
jgi:hypothetical protein